MQNAWRKNTKLSESEYDKIFFGISFGYNLKELTEILRESNNSISEGSVRRAFEYLLTGLFSDLDFVSTILGICDYARRISHRSEQPLFPVQTEEFRALSLASSNSQRNSREVLPLSYEYECLFTCSIGPKSSDIRLLIEIENSREFAIVRAFKRKQNCTVCKLGTEEKKKFIPALNYLLNFRRLEERRDLYNLYLLTQWQRFFQALVRQIDSRNEIARNTAFRKTESDPELSGYSRTSREWETKYMFHFRSALDATDAQWDKLWSVYRKLLKLVALYKVRGDEYSSPEFENPFFHDNDTEMADFTHMHRFGAKFQSVSAASWLLKQSYSMSL